MKNKKIAWLVKVAILSALSVVLYFLRFSLPLFPPFLQLQFSSLPVIIGGFLLGPLGGMSVLLLRTVLTMPFTQTALVGELADFVIGTAYVLVASLIYHRQHTKQRGLMGLIFGTVSWIVVACITNYFVLVPFYIELAFKGDVNSFIGILSYLPLTVTEESYKIVYVLCAALPFNLIVATVVSVVTFIVYKRLSNLFKKFDHFEGEELSDDAILIEEETDEDK